ncbi:envelope glycoprotein L [Psittacid alphaherpesvirus 5]|uniref:Envelope glycoprotein L n=1 Tax=Psittacid alphaherpesvirus 5 TaxID=2972693 RepID=A0A5P9JP41_9ALPH|nr:envelope glycoprotein L [Psittacid alphaherpesvirus 5]QFU14602.1 envelope glycoprotein L [Psittacid alphaherpesvirus 5]UOO01073.1 envelope glycoprotein L [Psittacid alphaherpesvirus 5]
MCIISPAYPDTNELILPRVFQSVDLIYTVPCATSKAQYGPVPSSNLIEDLTGIVVRPYCPTLEVLLYFNNGYTIRVNPYLTLRLISRALSDVREDTARVLRHLLYIIAENKFVAASVYPNNSQSFPSIQVPDDQVPDAHVFENDGL